MHAAQKAREIEILWRLSNSGALLYAIMAEHVHAEGGCADENDENMRKYPRCVLKRVYCYSFYIHIAVTPEEEQALLQAAEEGM